MNDSISRNDIHWSKPELLKIYGAYFDDPSLQDETIKKKLIENIHLLNSYLSRWIEVEMKNKEDILQKLDQCKSWDNSSIRLYNEEYALFSSFKRRKNDLSALVQLMNHFLIENSIVGIDLLGFRQAEEGSMIKVEHFSRERDRKIIEAKKQRVLTDHGRLECEACGFDFEKNYGKRGENFIEVHHTLPLSQFSNKHITFLEDLALLCSNCHSMIHRAEPWLTVEELRRIYKEGRAA